MERLGIKEKDISPQLPALPLLALLPWGIWIVFVRTPRSPVLFAKSNMWAEAPLLCPLLHAGVFTGTYLEITDGEGAWERQCEDAEARGLLWNDSNAVEILRGQDMLLL